MSTAPRFGAAASPALTGRGAARRRHPAPSTGDQLVRASSDLDALIRDSQLGVRSAGSFDDQEERAQAIAAAIVAAFRRPGRAVNPPLQRNANGAWF